jgi:kinesin family member 2/24
MSTSYFQAIPPRSRENITESFSRLRAPKPRIMQLDKDFTIGIRVRPLLPQDASRSANILPDHTARKVQIDEPKTSLKAVPSAADAFRTHTFSADHVYGQDSETTSLFQDLVQPLLPFATQGGHANVMVYGQTGTGKTHTITKISELLAESLFEIEQLQGEYPFTLSLQAIELYGPTVRDLVAATSEVAPIPPPSKPGKALTAGKVDVVEDVAGHSTFARATRVSIEDLSSLKETLVRVWSARQTHATERNDQSSRSHAIVRLFFSPRDASTAISSRPGMLQLIDLAGSERAASDSANHSAERFRETTFINKTLMTLKECIRKRTESLSSKSAIPHIPYRGSKLTLALKEAFELASRHPAKTVFIGTISPALRDVPASINTLRYASALVQAPGTLKLSMPDKDNVTGWDHEKAMEWIEARAGCPLGASQDAGGFLKQHDGLFLSQMPEQEFMRRLQKGSAGQVGAVKAQKIYLAFWDRVVHSRTKVREAAKKEWQKEYHRKRTTFTEDDV